MASNDTVSFRVDNDAEAAYIRLSTELVDRTVQATEDVLVDLDRHGVAVGIEVLDLDAVIPYESLTRDFHIRSEVVDKVKTIRPSINSYLLTYAPDGVSTATAQLALVNA